MIKKKKKIPTPHKLPRGVGGGGGISQVLEKFLSIFDTFVF